MTCGQSSETGGEKTPAMKLFAFVGVLLCCACSNPFPKNTSGTAELILLDNRRISSKAAIDAFVEDVEWVPLETSRAAIIGNTPYQMAICDGRLFLFFTGINSTLAIFDLKTGGFIKKITSTGSGPGEFSKITSFNIDQRRGVVEIAAGFERKVLEFDLNGNFKTEVFAEIPFTNMASLPNGEKVVYSQSENRVFTGYLHDNELITLAENYAFRTGTKVLDSKHPVYLVSGYIFFPYGDSLRFLKPFNDTIFSVLARGVVPKYIAHFKKGAVDPEFWENPRLQGARDEIYIQNRIPSLMPVFFENSQLLFGVYQSDDALTYHFIYDKKDKTVRHNFGGLWYNEWDIPLPPPLHISGEGLLFLVTPSEWKTLLAEHPDPSKLPEGLRVAVGRAEDGDNPFLLHVRFKG